MFFTNANDNPRRETTQDGNRPEREVAQNTPPPKKGNRPERATTRKREITLHRLSSSRSFLKSEPRIVVFLDENSPAMCKAKL